MLNLRVHHRALDRQLVDIGRRLKRAGLVHGRSGNLSALGGTRVRISVAGARLDQLRRADLVWIPTNEPPAVGRRPSSEAALHTAIYALRPDVGAILHTHSPYATAWASMAIDGLPLRLEEASYYGMGTHVAVVPYAPSGSQQLAESTAAHLGDGAAVLLERHGAVAVATNVYRALDIAESLEHQARVSWLVGWRQADRDPALFAPASAEPRSLGSAHRPSSIAKLATRVSDD